MPNGDDDGYGSDMPTDDEMDTKGGKGKPGNLGLPILPFIEHNCFNTTIGYVDL